MEMTTVDEATTFDDINFDDVVIPASTQENKGEEPANEKVDAKEEQNKEATEEAPKEEVAQETKEEGKEDETKPDEESPEVVPATIEAVDGSKIPENTLFRKKVDGKPVEFTVKQAIDEYTGKLAIQPRFAEANRIKQKAEHFHASTTKQLNEAKTTIQRFFEHSANGEHRDAIAALCQFTGQDPEKEWGKFQELQASNFKRLTEMTPEQLREAQIREENEYYKRQLTRKDEERKSEVEKQEIESKISEAITKRGINRDTFEVGYQYLLDMKNQGNYNGPIDVATCAEAGWDIRTWNAIDEVVAKELPEKKGDNAFYLEVLDDTKKYNLTQADWIKILDKARKANKSPASSSNIARKKAKNAPLSVAKDAKKAQAEVLPETWDEI